MATALCLSLQNCGRCKQFEAKCQLPGMEPIVCTQPMELVHLDYVGMEVEMEKWLYDRKVGAVELRPGDRVLVRLDAFRGQRRKLKN